MNRELIERTLNAMARGYMYEEHTEYCSVMEALKAELEKPEPKPVAFICRDALYFWPSQDEFCDQKDNHILLYTKGTT